jgi:hypothetical protein
MIVEKKKPCAGCKVLIKNLVISDEILAHRAKVMIEQDKEIKKLTEITEKLEKALQDLYNSLRMNPHFCATMVYNYYHALFKNECYILPKKGEKK